MQRPKEAKRRAILNTAAKLFATRPYHRVRLEEIAAEAGVGKGTIYVYFKGKDELYFALLHEGWAGVVNGLCAEFEGDRGPAVEALRRIVDELVGFAMANPSVFEVMRAAGGRASPRLWMKTRGKLTDLIERTIRRGNRRGELRDPSPRLTALCVPGLVRSVFLFGPRPRNQRAVVRQLTRLIERGICNGEAN